MHDSGPGAWRADSVALLRLAGPIILSQLAFVLMGLLDTVMSGWAGATEQAVVGLGTAIWIPVFLALMAVVQAISPIVAHHHGAGNVHAIVRDTRQALWLGGVLGVLPLFALPWVPDLLAWAGADAILREKTVLFAQGIALGLPAALMFRALSFYSASIGRPQPITVLAYLGLAVNAGLNAILIPGAWGLPALGGAACGWATGASMWVTLVLMVAHTARSPHYAVVWLYDGWDLPDFRVLLRLLRLGLPMGGAQLAEVSAFTGVALLMAPLGPVAIAAHQVALNFASLIFMVPLGLSVALSIRVGQALGAGDPARARVLAWHGIAVAVVLGMVLIPVLVAGRPWIVQAYTSDTTVREVASTLLLFSATWQLVDAVQVCANGALRGYKVTLAPMLLMVSAFWAVGLPIGAHLATVGLPAWGLGPLGVYGYWAGLVSGLVMAAAGLALLLRRVTRTPPLA